MRRLLRLVVTQGTAKKADVSGIAIGGKTGTAEKIINGRYSSDKLISSLPSGGLVARISIENLDQKVIKMVQKFNSVKNVLRVGNETIEVLMENFENNLPKLMKFLFENEVKIYSMSRDIANFRRFFQKPAFSKIP